MHRSVPIDGVGLVVDLAVGGKFGFGPRMGSCPVMVTQQQFASTSLASILDPKNGLMVMRSFLRRVISSLKRFVGGASGQIISVGGRWGSENALQRVVARMGSNLEGDGGEQVTEAEVITDIGSAMSVVELLSGSWCRTGQHNGSVGDVAEVPKGGFNGAQGFTRLH
ncbi:hypothetical protein NE237_028132 [Protea cynaroides]|uniref:Uncharacterized protein n=1 Tax=Protea cynaroides TaxID=273540 RepID=A0A9Q0GPQ0_9MAGN|nr:hypothetical protein NE237_028132 [Protea cynaroides]